MKARPRTISLSGGGTAARRKHLRDALGNAALEGIKPGPRAMEDLNAVAGGTLTGDQYRLRVKARYGLQG